MSSNSIFPYEMEYFLIFQIQNGLETNNRNLILHIHKCPKVQQCECLLYVNKKLAMNQDCLDTKSALKGHAHIL